MYKEQRNQQCQCGVCVCRLGSYAASNNNSIGCISQTTARFGGVVYCTRGEEEMVWERG